MKEIDVFMEMLDNKSINYILSEFFLDKNFKQDVKVKKLKLIKLIKDPSSLKCNKKYKKSIGSPFQIIKMNLADNELINCEDEEFMLLLVSEKEDQLSKIEQFCTASIKFPNIIKKNMETIMENYKNGEFLFKGINELNVNVGIDTIKLRKLEKELENLRRIIDNTEKEVNKIREENNHINNEKNEIILENRKLNKLISKNEKDIMIIEQDNYNLKIQIKECKDKVIMSEKKVSELTSKNNILQKEIDILQNKNKKFEEEKLRLKSTNKKQIEKLNLEELMRYDKCLIHSVDLNYSPKILPNFIFLEYTEFSRNINTIIEKLKKAHMQKVYIQGNNISDKNLHKIKRKLRNEKISFRTILFSNESELVEKILINENNIIWG